MNRFYIKDATVHAAFDILEALVESAPIARAMRERREDEKKIAFSKAFLEATGNNAEREAIAKLDSEYAEACLSLYEAIEADEKCRREQSKCEAIIEAWCTSSSNFRSMGKVA